MHVDARLGRETHRRDVLHRWHVRALLGGEAEVLCGLLRHRRRGRALPRREADRDRRHLREGREGALLGRSSRHGADLRWVMGADELEPFRRRQVADAPLTAASLAVSMRGGDVVFLASNYS